MTYIEDLIRECFRNIPNPPEVANLIRIPEEYSTIYVELHSKKDQDPDQAHAAIAYWQVYPETEWGGFMTVVISIGLATWHFRGRHEHDIPRMRYVGTSEAHPFSMPYTPWYEGMPGSGVTTPTCTRCHTQASTVRQAHFGGGEVKGVARCENCQQEACVSLAGDAPTLEEAFSPSLW